MRDRILFPCAFYIPIFVVIVVTQPITSITPPQLASHFEPASVFVYPNMSTTPTQSESNKLFEDIESDPEVPVTPKKSKPKEQFQPTPREITFDFPKWQPTDFEYEGPMRITCPQPHGSNHVGGHYFKVVSTEGDSVQPDTAVELSIDRMCTYLPRAMLGYNFWMPNGDEAGPEHVIYSVDGSHQDAVHGSFRKKYHGRIVCDESTYTNIKGFASDGQSGDTRSMSAKIKGQLKKPQQFTSDIPAGSASVQGRIWSFKGSEIDTQATKFMIDRFTLKNYELSSENTTMKEADVENFLGKMLFGHPYLTLNNDGNTSGQCGIDICHIHSWAFPQYEFSLDASSVNRIVGAPDETWVDLHINWTPMDGTEGK